MFCSFTLGFYQTINQRDKRFSKQVAEHVVKARRESTRKVYDAKWRVYLDWANKRQIDPIKATPNVIADFLTFLFNEKKCQVSTIRGYRSMISNTLKFSAGFDIGSHPVLSDLIISFQLQTNFQVSSTKMGPCLCSFAYMQGTFRTIITMLTFSSFIEISFSHCHGNSQKSF